MSAQSPKPIAAQPGRDSPDVERPRAPTPNAPEEDDAPKAHRIAPLAVSIADAAAMLSLSDDTIRRAIDRGDLRASRLGHVWRIRVADIEGYLHQREKAQEGA